MRTERVSLADLRPDPNNPRESFEGLEELAAQFAYTPDRPGEPFTPPIVVADGNVYRIVEGHRRYHAMLGAGEVESCLCNVCDTMDEAAALAMMLATDAKEPLKEAERARGIQQMLALGIEEREVEALGRLERGDAGRVRRAMSLADRPEQLSLGQMFKIAEIEDDERARELARMCEEGEGDSRFWTKQRIYAAEQSMAGKRTALLNALIAQGVSPKPAKPSKADWAEYTSCWNAEDVPEKVAEMNEGHGDAWACWIFPGAVDQWGCTNHPRAAFYLPAADGGAGDGDGEEDRAAALKSFRKGFAEARERRLEWMASQIDRVAKLKHTAPIVWEAVRRKASLDAFEAETGKKTKKEFPQFVVPLVWGECDDVDAYEVDDAVVDGRVCWGFENEARSHIALLAAMEADGYELSDFEASTRDAVSAALQKQDGGQDVDEATEDGGEG